MPRRQEVMTIVPRPLAPEASLLAGLGRIPPYLRAGAILLIVAVGSLSLLPLWDKMYRLWTTDPLRSIGMVFPLVTCAGVLAAWRRLGWTMNGTFWALPLVALSILLARFITVSALVVGYNGLRIGLIGLGTVLFLYAIGAVLLFGGTRLLRASIAPLCLLLFINPVPRIFNSLVDLPLQHLSASTARAFAHLIGLQPTGVQLRMMFTPDFGMFIAPGCNGVRGSITLGFLALVFGYVRRLRPSRLLLITLAAFLLGYAVNLLRLCVLVVYYRVGVSLPSIQEYGVGIDYAIGATLFLLVTLGLGLLIRSLEPPATERIQKAAQRPTVQSTGFPLQLQHIGHAAVARSLCFLALTFAFIVPEIGSATWRPALRPSQQMLLSSFPATVGPYRLTRTWAEYDGNGLIAMAMSEYSASPDAGPAFNRMTFGLWVGSANHLVVDSKLIQGVTAQRTASFNASDRQALPVHFVTNFYDDGISRQYDAESICFDSGCTARFIDPRHKGFVFLVPEFFHLTLAPHSKSLPILLRGEWPASEPASSADIRAQFEADVRLFMAQVDLQSLVNQDGSQL